MSWAIATRAQPDRDGILLAGHPGTRLDPSEIGGLTGKWALDATAKPSLHAFAPVNRIPDAVLCRIDIDRLLRRPRRPGDDHG